MLEHPRRVWFNCVKFDLWLLPCLAASGAPWLTGKGPLGALGYVLSWGTLDCQLSVVMLPNVTSKKVLPGWCYAASCMYGIHYMAMNTWSDTANSLQYPHHTLICGGTFLPVMMMVFKIILSLSCISVAPEWH